MRCTDFVRMPGLTRGMILSDHDPEGEARANPDRAVARRYGGTADYLWRCHASPSGKRGRSRPGHFSGYFSSHFSDYFPGYFLGCLPGYLPGT